MKPKTPLVRRLLIALFLMLQVGIVSAVTLSEAIDQVRRQTSGRILKAETVREDGRSIHVIRVLTPEGRVRVFRIPA